MPPGLLSHVSERAQRSGFDFYIDHPPGRIRFRHVLLDRLYFYPVAQPSAGTGRKEAERAESNIA